MRKILTTLLAALVLGGTPLTAQSEQTTTIRLNVAPDKAFYRPGEPVQLHITADGGVKVLVSVDHLGANVQRSELALTNGEAAFSWTPLAEAPRGYGIDIHLLDEKNVTRADYTLAVDVLERWTQAPRYGFLSQFEPGRNDEAATMAWAARYHINGLQFYDWQYRHEQLLPPSEVYADVLGRQLSLDVVKRLIEAAHARNIAAMPYTAIYGASVAFYNQHPDWALFEKIGQPYRFGDNFLVIMDPSSGSPWTQHLLNQFADVLEKTAFDGIHIDQYGAPKIGRSARDEKVDLAQVFPEFINSTAKIVREKRGRGGATIFNLVGNWPVTTVAPSDQSVVYIEVWQPYRYFMDLHRLIVEAQKLGGGKPVILAAYIPPERTANVLLANAVIFASGGYHLELGEPGAMLSDPYFPKFGVMSDSLKEILRRYYDFLVRYEEWLALDTVDATESRAGALGIEGYTTGGRLRSTDRIAPIVRQGKDFETFSLVNFIGVKIGQWDLPEAKGPERLKDLQVKIYVERPVEGVFFASPDQPQPGVQLVTAEVGKDEKGQYIRFNLPSLYFWDMVVIRYKS